MRFPLEGSGPSSDRARSDAVINWMFDVDEVDESDYETPLLEELDIDIAYITRYMYIL